MPQQSLLQYPVVLSKGILLFNGGNMYQALYRTLRPEVFSDLLGQEHIIKILENQLGNGRVSHAYLFCGTRGTGKTTTARLLAKGVNCIGEGKRPCGICSNCESIRKGTFVDVIEIDAASNRGIENIRELRESVKYPPAVGRRKVYIIDEVHMLSTEAFNALLKTLEEPPENVMFILATTEPNKLPATVLSRCMRLDFKRISEKILEDRMMEICVERGVEAELSGIKLIAGNADGSVRDGLSILDQILAGGSKTLTREDVLGLLGATNQDALIELSYHITSGNIKEIFLGIDSLLQEGRDARQLIKDLISHYRGLLVTQFIDNPENLLNMSIENIERIKEQGKSLSTQEISRTIVEFSKTNLDARYSTQPRILLEVACIKLTQAQENNPSGIRERSFKSQDYKRVDRPTQKEEKAGEQADEQGDAQLGEQADEKSGEKSGQISEKTIEDKKNQPMESGSFISGEFNGGKSVGLSKEVGQINEEAQALRNNFDKLAGDDLWDKALTCLEKEKATFRVARGATCICEVNQDCVVIEANSDFMLCRLEDNKELIESTLEELTGERKPIVPRIRTEAIVKDRSISAENTKKEVEEKFTGIAIEIDEEGE